MRVRPSGRKTYVIRHYSAHQRKKNLSLGTTKQLRLVATRRLARETLAELDIHGVDPQHEKRDRGAMPTLDEFVERYFHDHGDQLRSGPELRWLDKRQLRGRFGRIALMEISIEGVLKMRAELAENPYEANRARDFLHNLLNKAILCEVLPESYANPVKKVPRYREAPRESGLTPDDVARLVEAIDHIDTEHTRILFRTLLKVPFRKNEVMRATWEGFDAKNRVLRVESRSAIRGLAAQPLREDIAAQIAALPRFDGNPYIFPNRKRDTHIKDIDSQWKRIKELAGVKNARLHDLRRTIATDYARLGANAFQIQTALGQKTGIAAKHYVHLAAAEVSRELMELRAKSATIQ